MEKWLRVLSFVCLSYGVHLIADNEHRFGMFQTPSERAVKIAQYKKAKEEAEQEEEKQRALLLAQKEQQRKEEEQRQRELYAHKLKEKELAIEQKRLEVLELQLARERESEQIKYQRELLLAAREKERQEQQDKKALLLAERKKTQHKEVTLPCIEQFVIAPQDSLALALEELRESSQATDSFDQAIACAEKQLEVTLCAVNNQQHMIDTLHNELVQLSTLAYNN